jgi:CheY-like chemotaxis protein
MKVKILVIDDEDEIRKITVKFLEKNGSYELFQSANGREGIKMFESHHPDIVITVLNMPGMRGEEVARYIKKNPETKTKVIGIGTEADLQQVAKAAGCDRLIKTSFHLLKLQEMVEDILKSWSLLGR